MIFDGAGNGSIKAGMKSKKRKPQTRTFAGVMGDGRAKSFFCEGNFHNLRYPIAISFGSFNQVMLFMQVYKYLKLELLHMKA